jgi:hypothetical protein
MLDKLGCYVTEGSTRPTSRCIRRHGNKIQLPAHLSTIEHAALTKAVISVGFRIHSRARGCSARLISPVLQEELKITKGEIEDHKPGRILRIAKDAQRFLAVTRDLQIHG